VLLGLTAATAIFVGHYLNIPYPGWIATAAMLVLVIVVLSLSLEATALVGSVIAVLTMGAETSNLYVTPFGTAFLILTIELYGISTTVSLEEVGRQRIVNNVLGAVIALSYGLAVSWLLERTLFRRSPAVELA
jgi:hypothetical protein